MVFTTLMLYESSLVDDIDNILAIQSWVVHPPFCPSYALPDGHIQMKPNHMHTPPVRSLIRNIHPGCSLPLVKVASDAEEENVVISDHSFK